ncbi:unnamed protein product [Prorocentrum cordatum]|uniref:Uncharacterized protein n=1 Tax=Prorocentrum cordatum TaxID=2364126 RepID=A0ABN9PEC2_9DINO|nr:unnamed protein product [Polarella glacialis]
MFEDSGFSKDAGDAAIRTIGEDFMRLAVVALRRGRLPSGERLISRENWNRWAVPNLLPGGKLTDQLTEWQKSPLVSATFGVGDRMSEGIMKQSGAYGWSAVSLRRLHAVAPLSASRVVVCIAELWARAFFFGGVAFGRMVGLGQLPWSSFRAIRMSGISGPHPPGDLPGYFSPGTPRGRPARAN